MNESTATPINAVPGDAILVTNPDPKPGRKTTEFYFTGSTAAGMLALVTQVTDWRVQCACVLSAAIVAGMYSLGRARVKAAASEVLS